MSDHTSLLHFCSTFWLMCRSHFYSIRPTNVHTVNVQCLPNWKGYKLKKKLLTSLYLVECFAWWDWLFTWELNRHSTRHTSPMSVELQLRLWCLAEGYWNGDHRRPTGPYGLGRSFRLAMLWWIYFLLNDVYRSHHLIANILKFHDRIAWKH